MPSHFPWLKIKSRKIDSKKRQQNKRPDNYETVLILTLYFDLGGPTFGKKIFEPEIAMKTDIPFSLALQAIIKWFCMIVILPCVWTI